MSTPNASTAFIHEARTTWNGGMPQAESMEHARLAWAPYLEQWGLHMEKGFSHSIEGLTDTSTLGWIDDRTFWQSLPTSDISLDGMLEPSL